MNPYHLLGGVLLMIAAVVIHFVAPDNEGAPFLAGIATTLLVQHFRKEATHEH